MIYPNGTVCKSAIAVLRLTCFDFRAQLQVLQDPIRLLAKIQFRLKVKGPCNMDFR